MLYSVQIEQIGRNGVPVGQPTLREAASEREALAVVQAAIRDARRARQSVTFSVYDPGNHLILSYTGADGDRAAS